MVCVVCVEVWCVVCVEVWCVVCVEVGVCSVCRGVYGMCALSWQL
jgi:hypothetical protein